jgi:hypothetical protein
MPQHNIQKKLGTLPSFFLPYCNKGRTFETIGFFDLSFSIMIISVSVIVCQVFLMQKSQQLLGYNRWTWIKS